jgi:hypothetical protein
VNEEGNWNVMGRFKDALEEDEDVSWVTDRGQLTLAICAEGRDSLGATSPMFLSARLLVIKGICLRMSW